jgi:hypothetical protein
LNRFNVPVDDDAKVGLAPLTFTDVALANVTVALLIVAVPVAAPIPIAVAAPKALTVVKFVLNSVRVPVDDDASVGFVPLTFTVVAFDKVTVALLIVAIPVAAPIPIAVAAPKALTVVKFVLNNDNVPVELLTNDGLAPLTFTDVALAKVTVALLIVAVPVAAPIPIAVAAPAKFKVVAVVLIKL